jgi:hypothetical protein
MNVLLPRNLTGLGKKLDIGQTVLPLPQGAQTRLEKRPSFLF